MSEIQIGCSAQGWGIKKFVEAVSSISAIGFDAIECSAALVPQYEDRLHVFEEILEVSNLKLAAMTMPADFLNKETAEIEVERVANTARFLSANKSMVMLVSPINLAGDEDMSNDDWITFAAVLEEMSERCNEFGVALAYRPRAGFVGGSDREIKKILGMIEPDSVNLCFDTAEITLAGINPQKFFKSYQEKIIYTRLRDVSGAKRRKPTTSTEPGSAPQYGRGAVDFAKMGKIMQNNFYSGFAVIETVGESGPPEETSAGGFRYIMRKSGLFT